MKTQISVIGAATAIRQVERIVVSRVFAKAKRSQHLLRYLVHAALADPAQTIKEYTLATEVFDRDANYNPAIDATVRVEAGRLRTRLREYYGEEGKDDALLIELPKGAYCAILIPRGELEEQVAEIAEPTVTSIAQVSAPEPAVSPPTSARRRGALEDRGPPNFPLRVAGVNSRPLAWICRMETRQTGAHSR